MNVQENISLKPYHTFGAQSKARYFVEVTQIEDLKEAIGFAKQHSAEILFLGGGSNLLFTQNYEGLVIKLNLKGISERNISEDEVLVTAMAGENWHGFVQYNLEKNYGGLENLSLIPGNVGTSPMQNIGAYGVEIKDVFFSCKALNLDTLQLEEFNKATCNFGYRESFFKREGRGKYAIVEVTFKLTRKNHLIKTQYGAIAEELEKNHIVNPTIQEVSQAVVSIRQSKLPNPKEVGNAGSFFKNPVIGLGLYEDLKQNYPNIPAYPSGEMVKIPAGWLIETAGWKGKQIGNVATHQLQSLVVVNKTGEATGQEIFDFSTKIILSVKERFGIELEREVNII